MKSRPTEAVTTLTTAALLFTAMGTRQQDVFAKKDEQELLKKEELRAKMEAVKAQKNQQRHQTPTHSHETHNHDVSGNFRHKSR